MLETVVGRFKIRLDASTVFIAQLTGLVNKEKTRRGAGFWSPNQADNYGQGVYQIGDV